MSMIYSNFKVKRSVGMTQHPDGYNALSPINVLPDDYWSEHYEDFFAQSFRPFPASGLNCPAWSPAYRTVDNAGQEREFSDLMVFDLHGRSADDGFNWMVRNNLTGVIHSTRSDSEASPRSRLIFILHRPVNDRTYRQLWSRLAQEVFSSLTNPAHADFRQRYDQPRAARNQSTLNSHEGNLLNVEGVLAEPILAGDVLGLVCQAFAGELWSSKLLPRNR